jgi:hypothetical protein
MLMPHGIPRQFPDVLLGVEVRAGWGKIQQLVLSKNLVKAPVFPYATSR